MVNGIDQTFAEQVDTARWQWLRAHNERGALILVDEMLELATVGEQVAADDTAAVQSWLASRLLSKPTAEQIAAWDETPEKSFGMLVVSPFVLIQELDAPENKELSSL